jgi:hypothetical protein
MEHHQRYANLIVKNERIVLSKQNRKKKKIEFLKIQIKKQKVKVKRKKAFIYRTHRRQSDRKTKKHHRHQLAKAIFSRKRHSVKRHDHKKRDRHHCLRDTRSSRNEKISEEEAHSTRYTVNRNPKLSHFDSSFRAYQTHLLAKKKKL